MRRRILMALGMVAVLGAVVGAGAAPSFGSGGISTIHVREHAIHLTFVDVGDTGPSQGDYLTFADPLFDPATGKQVGHNLGTCYLAAVKANLYECSVTFFLPKGQIVGQGAFDGNGSTTTAAITGGTGAYRDASGTVALRGVSQTVDDFVFTVST